MIFMTMRMVMMNVKHVVRKALLNFQNPNDINKPGDDGIHTEGLRMFLLLIVDYAFKTLITNNTVDQSNIIVNYSKPL